VARQKFDGLMTEILVPHLALIETGAGRVSGAYAANRLPPALRFSSRSAGDRHQ